MLPVLFFQAKAVTFGVKSGQLGSTDPTLGPLKASPDGLISRMLPSSENVHVDERTLLNVGSAQTSIDTQASTVVLGSNTCFCMPC